MQDFDPWEFFVMSVAFGINSTAHSTTQIKPGQLIFGRDMPLHAMHFSNWEHIRLRKQNKIDYNDALENESRSTHKHKVGDSCTK